MADPQGHRRPEGDRGEVRLSDFHVLARALRLTDIRHTDECWTWKGSHSRNGYARIKVSGRLLQAHRVMYEGLVGPIPDGLTIDHLCRNRGCVNPAHLEAVTHGVNVLRGVGFSAQNARKTHCKRGHLLSGSNLYVRCDGRRVCITCKNERERGYRRSALDESENSTVREKSGGAGHEPYSNSDSSSAVICADALTEVAS
jgi:hypothetical protein